MSFNAAQSIGMPPADGQRTDEWPHVNRYPSVGKCISPRYDLDL